MIETPWLVGKVRPLGILENCTLDGEDGDDFTDISYDQAAQQYSLYIDATLDNANAERTLLLWKRIDGDFILHARINAVMGARSASWGLVVLSEFEQPRAEVKVMDDGYGVRILTRHRDESNLIVGRDDFMFADTLHLERNSGTFIVKVAYEGEPWSGETTVEVATEGTLDVGLCLETHTSPSSTRVVFDNVRLTVPAQPDQTPYNRPLGSHLEVLELATGTRQIIHSSATPFEAPNWTTDGKALIYNSQGRLYRFDLATGDVSEIATGFATRNNNDHVLSFDGSMIAISDHTEEGHSIVYTVPVGGGTPRRVTAQGPSYLHGWSPDGKHLVYTGARDDEYDIYRISVDGGEETRLTTAPGLDDGPEYTPDGTYIYFNSVRSGTMQIWRMKPDGSDQEQITDDEFNNWFAHISPDGTEFVFLSYLPDVDPSAHPPYKHVYLRRMPLDGGTPEVIAYVYGGQGTINVPSWSPDGTHLAFVSNTGME